MRLVLGIVVPAALGMVFAAACGGGTANLPEPALCPTVVAAPTAATGQGGTQRYFQTVASGQVRVKSVGRAFIDRWPNRKFSRSAAFRQDLAKSSDDAACFAQQLISIAPPNSRFEEYDKALDDVLAQFIADAAVGREAARQRNVSKYRDWLKAVDELPGKLDVVDLTRPPLRP
jgi:hypothetical protein